MLELREVRGFAMTTCLKYIWRWDKRTRTSLPQNNFAKNVPPGTSIFVEILKAASSNCAWMYSSKSGSPVTATHRGQITASLCQYYLSVKLISWYRVFLKQSIVIHSSRNLLLLCNLKAHHCHHNHIPLRLSWDSSI